MWTKEQVRNILLTNDDQLAKAVVLLYRRQTADEQRVGETRHRNGVGFNGTDAQILSSFAKFYMRTGFLTPKQLFIARKKMPKYAGQLADIANERREEYA